jgi:RNA polymerase sigma-70 factor (ECF subfamily)
MSENRFLQHFVPAQRALRAYLHAATRDVHETDDLLQEVSNVLWEKFDQYDEGRPFVAWAVGIARLQVLKWRQAKHRARKILSEQALAELAEAAAQAVVEPDPRPAMLAGCMQGLAARARKVIELKYQEGLPIREIAERLGFQVGAIEMALVRARRALRECIERKMGNSSDLQIKR